MASGTADLQRDLGGAIMQSIFGALLTAGYASAAGVADLELRAGRHREHAGRVDEVVLERRRHGVAAYPPSSRRRSSPARRPHSCRATSGPTSPGWSRSSSAPSLVFVCFPKQDEEEALLARYATEDAA